MRMFGAVAAVAVALWSSGSLADPYDLRIYQLGNPARGAARFDPEANGNFRVFAREFAAALTSVNLTPPETLGHAAFSVTAELSGVVLKTDEFKLPTEQNLAGFLLIPSVHVRKGLPFSFELGGRAAWIEKSRMGAGTVELKWALNEGFNFLPDLSVRAHLTRLINSRDFDLTAGGADFGLGKQFAVGGMVTLTPYVGWNQVFVEADSNNVDFRPDRTAEESISTTNAQLQDTNVFDQVHFRSNSHSRFYGGMRFIGGVVQIGLEVSVSTLGRFQDADTGTQRVMPSVVAYNGTIGLDF